MDEEREKLKEEKLKEEEVKEEEVKEEVKEEEVKEEEAKVFGSIKNVWCMATRHNRFSDKKCWKAFSFSQC